MSERWVKLPSPGQFRGEGDWTKWSDTCGTEAEWDYHAKTGFLPTHVGEEPPKEQQP